MFKSNLKCNDVRLICLKSKMPHKKVKCPKKAKGLKFKEAKRLIANFQYPKTSRCAAVKIEKYLVSHISSHNFRLYDIPDSTFESDEDSDEESSDEEAGTKVRNPLSCVIQLHY